MRKYRHRFIIQSSEAIYTTKCLCIGFPSLATGCAPRYGMISKIERTPGLFLLEKLSSTKSLMKTIPSASPKKRSRTDPHPIVTLRNSQNRCQNNTCLGKNQGDADQRSSSARLKLEDCVSDINKQRQDTRDRLTHANSFVNKVPLMQMTAHPGLVRHLPHRTFRGNTPRNSPSPSRVRFSKCFR